MASRNYAGGGERKRLTFGPWVLIAAWITWDRLEPVGGVTMGFRILFFPSEIGRHACAQAYWNMDKC